MSQLIQMRQRIKAISTIRKITSAMRLISRSFHTRMYRDRHHLQEYRQTLSQIFHKITAYSPSWNLPTFLQTADVPPKELYIIIGSQKGLCGGFNTTITHWIDKNRERLVNPTSHVIVLGKKMDEYLKKQGVTHPRLLPELKLTTLDTLLQDLLKEITTPSARYTKVVTVANCPKTFLSHEYKETQLIPFVAPEPLEGSELFDYVPSHSADLVLDTLVNMHLMITIHSILFESLLGEQAARFIAMDNATRNANNFLEVMNLQFNKMRQAKITKELAELAGAFETQSAI